MSTGKVGNAVIFIAVHVFVLGWFGLLYWNMTSVPSIGKTASVSSYDNQNGIAIINIPDSSNGQTRIKFIDHHVEEMTNYLPWSARNAISSVEIFNSYSCGTSHCHTHPDGRICMSMSVMQSDPEVFYHEFGHARHLQLNREKSGFEERWKKVQGGKLHEDLHQDVAEHTMQAYQQFLGKPSIYDSFSNDSFYQQKLKLLKEFGFIN